MDTHTSHTFLEVNSISLHVTLDVARGESDFSWYVLYFTGNEVFHHDLQTPRRGLKKNEAQLSFYFEVGVEATPHVCVSK